MQLIHGLVGTTFPGANTMGNMGSGLCGSGGHDISSTVPTFDGDVDQDKSERDSHR